jgi:hypothetical protein
MGGSALLHPDELAGAYRTWLARQAEYRNEVQRIQKQAPGLSELVRVAT